MLSDILVKEKETVINRWLELTLNTYPDETKKFLGSKKDRFSNPVGSNIREGLNEIYNLLVTNADPENPEFSYFMDKIVRIRAVQEFTPSNALAFIFFLKHAVREVLAKNITDRGMFEELLTFESRIDRLALLAFNIYMQCRETLFDIRAFELKNRTSRILEVISRKYGMPEDWAEPDNNNSSTAT
jgi:hypothetical protein